MTINDPSLCARCGGPARYAGFVSLPPKSIYYCEPCDLHRWVDGPAIPPNAAPPQAEQQAQQQQQGKLDPDE